MRRMKKIIYLFLGISILLGQNGDPPKPIIKEFTPAGRIEALMDVNHSDEWLLVQLDLKNDSLFNLVNDIVPAMELYSGPASYHRIMEFRHLEQIQSVLTDEFYLYSMKTIVFPVPPGNSGLILRMAVKPREPGLMMMPLNIPVPVSAEPVTA